MQRIFRQLGIAIGCGLLFSSFASAATIEEVQKVLADARTKVKSYTAKTKMMQDIDMGGGNTMKGTMEGSIEWMRKGEKILYRNDMKGSTVQNFGGQETKMESTISVISDGDFMYSLNEVNGQKTAAKLPVDPNLSGDAKLMFETMKKDSELKVLPDEKIDGADCFVIEVTPKDKSSAQISKTVLYMRKDNGLMAKNEVFETGGKKISSTSTTDFKVNAEIPADRFAFKAPAGVEMMDLTKQPGK